MFLFAMCEVSVRNKSSWLLCYSIFFCNFVPQLVHAPSMMKREPGENPGQTRCCVQSFEERTHVSLTALSGRPFAIRLRARRPAIAPKEHSPRGFGYSLTCYNQSDADAKETSFHHPCDRTAVETRTAADRLMSMHGDTTGSEADFTRLDNRQHIPVEGSRGQGHASRVAPSDDFIPAALCPGLEQCRRRAEVSRRRADQGLWRPRRAEDGQRQVAWIAARGRLPRRRAHHQRAKRHCGPRQILADHSGVGVALQRQQDRTADDSQRICLGIDDLSPHATPRQHLAHSQLRLWIVQHP